MCLGCHNVLSHQASIHATSWLFVNVQLCRSPLSIGWVVSHDIRSTPTDLKREWTGLVFLSHVTWVRDRRDHLATAFFNIITTFFEKLLWRNLAFSLNWKLWFTSWTGLQMPLLGVQGLSSGFSHISCAYRKIRLDQFVWLIVATINVISIDFIYSLVENRFEFGCKNLAFIIEGQAFHKETFHCLLCFLSPEFCFRDLVRTSWTFPCVCTKLPIICLIFQVWLPKPLF